MSTELAVIEKSGFELVPFFTKGTGVDDILKALEAEIMAHVPDVSTVKSRAEITANISKAKAYRLHLFDCRKKLSAEYKLIPSTIDKCGKKVNDFLLEIEAKARIQLTEWEIEEKARKEAAKIKLEVDGDHEIALLQFENAMRERKEEAARVEQARIDRDELIKKQAADDARIEAEQKAAKDLERIEREKQDAIDREIQAKVNEAKAKQDVIDAEEREIVAIQQAETDRILAARQAKLDAETAAKNARQEQVNKQNLEAAMLKAEQEAREADKAHRGKINKQAVSDFMACGMDEANATLAVKALAAKKISNAGISY